MLFVPHLVSHVLGPHPQSKPASAGRAAGCDVCLAEDQCGLVNQYTVGHLRSNDRVLCCKVHALEVGFETDSVLECLVSAPSPACLLALAHTCTPAGGPLHVSVPGGR